ncbi:MAG TPA: hypothetical protein VHF67_09315 [Gaiellaceae bacterium]|nr:hypothetical protein [Gaiellaceae bacterium]
MPMIAIDHSDPEPSTRPVAALAEAWLADAYDLVATGWCQGTSARDADGRPVAAHSPTACEWSLTGSLLRVLRTSEAEPELALHAFQRASLAVTAAVNGVASVWNDAPRRRADDVLDALAIAISLVREPPVDESANGPRDRAHQPSAR